MSSDKPAAEWLPVQLQPESHFRHMESDGEPEFDKATSQLSNFRVECRKQNKLLKQTNDDVSILMACVQQLPECIQQSAWNNVWNKHKINKYAHMDLHTYNYISILKCK